MLIHWITDGIKGSPDIGFSSSLASNRYRAILPAEQLRKDGHTVHFIEMARWTAETSGATTELPDVCIIGKLLPNNDPNRFQRLSQRILEGAAKASAQGVVVVADFSDDHFDNPQIGSYWRALAARADVCTAGSDAMAQVVRSHSRGPVATVHDPLASPIGKPKVFAQGIGLPGWMQKMLGGQRFSHRLKLAWYGNHGNWPAMQRWADTLPALATAQALLVWIVTQPNPSIERYVEAFNKKNRPAALMEFVPWDESTQWSVVADADIVLVPSDTSLKGKAVKSANRVTDAMNAGRYVIASPLEAYESFRSYVSLTDEPTHAVREYLANPQRAMQMLVDGQMVVHARHNVTQVVAEWLRAIRLKTPTSAGVTSAPALATFQPSPLAANVVRLNLGCGDKILPGYVNVDVVEARAGKSPDVICDLHELSCFEDGHADEVMAIHVVEHFWRWEVEEILKEWMRVLKPGGKMILECPNLLSACEALLAEPEVRSRPDKAGQTSMWVFYGDPGWKDPLMIHRWGYTPYSLAQLMNSVGLINVRQEAAVYKLREPRDMRLVGEKNWE